MSMQYWALDNGVLAVTEANAGNYISKQLGLEAQQVRAGVAMEIFKDPAAAVTEYNKKLKESELAAGAAFKRTYDLAAKLGYSEDMAKNYATQRAATWLESEIQLLDLTMPYGSTDLMVNAKVGVPVLGGNLLQIRPDSSVPVDVQQRVPIHRQAISAAGAKKTNTRGKGKGHK
jgi:hypothetical protein